MPLPFHARARALLLETGRSTRSLRGRGLTGELRRVFYPRYDFHKVRRVLPPPTGPPVGGAAAGLRRGRLVDSEISDWADRGAKPKHPFARKFVKLCAAQRWTPVASQVAVEDEANGVATLADLVVATARRELLVLELKVGFSGHHDAGLNRLAAPFEKFTDSPKNQHLLQTAFTLHMFRKTFPSLAPTSRGLLVRIVDRGIEVTALEQRFARTAATAARRFKR